MSDDSTPNAPGDYTITATNFGPIGEAEVDLRPLTVFVGPSNTGKSYLATLLYALHRSFHELAGHRHQHPSFVPLRFRATPPPLDSETASDLRNWCFPDRGERSPTLPDSVCSVIRQLIEAPPGLDEHLTEKASWCFGVGSFEDLVRHGQSAAARIGIHVPRPRSDGFVDYLLTVRGEESRLNGRIHGAAPLLTDLDSDVLHLVNARLGDASGSFHAAESSLVEDWLPRNALQLLAGTIRASLLHPFERSIYYLSAARSGVMLSHRVLVGSLIRNAASAGSSPPGELPLLSGVMADFLDQLLNLDRLPGRTRHRSKAQARRMAALAENVESAVLRGAVRTESTAVDYPEFFYRPHGWKRDLPLTQASSMVSELAPVVLYVRHLVCPGDVLIVEEPEAHLHPAMQVEVIGRLAELVEAGVRVVITTHSEWVLEELANLVRQSQAEDAGETALRPERVGVWRFHPPREREGARVTEIKMDDDGLFDAGYDQVAMDVHNRWADLTGVRNEYESVQHQAFGRCA